MALEFPITPPSEVPESGTPEWVRWKRRRIGGHAAAAILGKHPKLTIQDVFDLIVYGIEPRAMTEEDEAFLGWRAAMEPLAADRYVEKTGRMIQRTKSMVVQEFPACIVSPDRKILKDPRGVGLLEIKTAYPSLWARYELGGLPEFPWIQNQFYLWGSGYSWGDICVADVNNGKILTFEHAADVGFHRLLHQRIVDFLGMVEREERPASAPDNIRVPEFSGKMVTALNEEAAVLFNRLTGHVARWDDLQKEAKAAHDEAREQLKTFMKGMGAQVIQLGPTRAHLIVSKGQRRLDEKALLRDYPDLDLDEYKKRGKGYEYVRVYHMKEKSDG